MKRIVTHMRSPITLRSIVLICVLAGLAYIIIKEYAAKIEREQIISVIRQHQADTEKAMNNAEAAWLGFQESEKRNSVQLEYMEKLNDRMDAFAQILVDERKYRERTQQAFFARIPIVPTHKKPRRKKQSPKHCYKKIRSEKDIGGNIVVQDLLVPIPCQ